MSPNSCAAARELGAAVFPEAGQTIAGFHLVEELGRGAFARVFLARERQLADRPVALKVTRRGSREPQTLARLQHTHIVPVHSHRIDPATGLHLLCMPYFGRMTLARVLADPRGPDGAVRGPCWSRRSIGSSRASELPPGALGRPARHSRSDLRPGDRLVGRPAGRGARPRPRPGRPPPRHQAVERAGDRRRHADAARLQPGARAGARGRSPAGSRRWAERSTTCRRAVEGSREGCSDLVDCRADIYSLGVVLFEALTGKRPFSSPRRGGSMVDLLNRAADLRLRPLAPLRDRHPEIPAAFETVIRRCLEPEPNDRYQRGCQLAADLQAVADDLPLPYTREPWPGRAAAWLRRRRRRIATAATDPVRDFSSARRRGRPAHGADDAAATGRRRVQEGRGRHRSR